MKSKLNWD